MQVKIFQDQIRALKRHPQIKRVQTVDKRLLKLIFSPNILLSSCAIRSRQYVGEDYRIKIELPFNYPEEAPNIKFVDPIQHINIGAEDGLVHMPLLEEDWSPCLSLNCVIDALNTLLNQPENNPRYYPSDEIQDSGAIGTVGKNQQPSSNNQNKLTRKLKRTFSKLSVVSYVPPCAEEEDFQDVTTTPSTPVIVEKKSKLRRLKTLVQSSSNQFSDKEEKALVESEKRGPYFEPSLSNIHEVSDQHQSKNFSQLIESISSPYFKNNRGESHKRENSHSYLTNSIIKLQQVKGSKQLLRSTQACKPEQKNIIDDTNHLKIPKKSRVKNEQHKQVQKNHSPSIPTLNKKFLEDYPTQRRTKESNLTTTMQLEGPNRQLRNINNLLNTFYKQYEELAKRQETTSCETIKNRISKRLVELISMIEEVESLSLEVKQNMLARVRRQVRQ